MTKNRIPLNVWKLGFVSFLMNLSSVLIVITIPFYVNFFLCINISTIGILEGTAEGISFFVRILSGFLSDHFKKRKNIILIGYLVSLISRLVLVLFNDLNGVVLSRCLDKLGNGIQSSPRDAVIGEMAPSKFRGINYSFSYGISIGGSLVGSIIVFF